jgi:hypothetical protein
MGMCRGAGFVDSPLAVNASDIFRKHPEIFDEETREFVMNINTRAGFSAITLYPLGG